VKAHSHSPLAPFVIVLDALDECVDAAKAETLLDLLATEFAWLPFPVLLFITSRPEFRLQSKFHSDLISPISSSILLHDIDPSIVTLDIETFLHIALGKISSSRGPGPWYCSGDIKLLAEKASGLFIYAATAVKFIGDAEGIPEKQMQIMLGLQHVDDLNPYALIDGLYLQILCNSIIQYGKESDWLTSDIYTILGTIATLQTPLAYNALKLFLGIEDGDLRNVLCRLSSVIHYPCLDDDEI
jgi:hypothetical protein